MPSIEDIVAMKAMEDQGPSLEQLLAAGAITGGTLGAVGGQPIHALGNQINRGKDALAARQGLTRSRGQNIRSRFRPGNRMAMTGGGALLGLLAAAAGNQVMPDENEAASLLAKAQMGQLTQHEKDRFEAILASGYANPAEYGVA